MQFCDWPSFKGQSLSKQLRNKKNMALGGNTGPRSGLFHFECNLRRLKWSIFHLGQVASSNKLFYLMEPIKCKIAQWQEELIESTFDFFAAIKKCFAKRPSLFPVRRFLSVENNER